MDENKATHPRDEQTTANPINCTKFRSLVYVLIILLAAAVFWDRDNIAGFGESSNSNQKASIIFQENNAEAKIPSADMSEIPAAAFTIEIGNKDKRSDEENAHDIKQESTIAKTPASRKKAESDLLSNKPENESAPRSEKNNNSPKDENQAVLIEEIYSKGFMLNFPLQQLGQHLNQTEEITYGKNRFNDGQGSTKNKSEPDAVTLQDEEKSDSIDRNERVNKPDLEEAQFEYRGRQNQTIPQSDHPIKITCIGGSGNLKGTICYRLGGDSIFQTATMNSTSSEILEYNLPAALLGMRGLEYYFYLTKGQSEKFIGSALDPYVFIVSLTNEQAQFPNIFSPSLYQIVGVPIKPRRGEISSVFCDDLGPVGSGLWRVGRYRCSVNADGDYHELPEVMPGRGYWLATHATATFGTAGTSVRPNYRFDGRDYYSVALDSGWNQLGNPLPFDVSLTEMLFELNGIVVTELSDSILENAAYWYNGTDYDQVTTIPVWSGVFLYVKKTGVSALIRYRAAGHSQIKPMDESTIIPGENNWELGFELEVSGLNDDDNFAGVRPDAVDGSDRYDFSDPPPAPDGPKLAFRSSVDDERLLRTDYRKPFTEGASWEMEFSPATDRRLVCRGIDHLPENMEAWLAFDVAMTLQLREGMQISVPDKASTAQLFVGNKTFLDNKTDLTRPLTFELYQNYPNPFNPKTSIRFTVPQSGHVTLAVYNILGQVVAILADEEMESGDYTIIWNGRDATGRPAASGIYFYRIQTGEFTKTNKMLLLK